MINSDYIEVWRKESELYYITAVQNKLQAPLSLT
jgi:hypothetical protein